MFIMKLSVVFMCVFSTSLEVESIIRQTGAIPATVGILKGKIHVGEYTVGSHETFPPLHFIPYENYLTKVRVHEYV